MLRIAHRMPPWRCASSDQRYCARRKEELGDIFGKYGEVKDCYIPRDHATGQSRGFGFVRFESEDDAQAAIEGCDNMDVSGRALRVQVAQVMHRRPTRPVALCACTESRGPLLRSTRAQPSPLAGLPVGMTATMTAVATTATTIAGVTAAMMIADATTATTIAGATTGTMTAGATTATTTAGATTGTMTAGATAATTTAGARRTTIETIVAGGVRTRSA